MIDPQLPSEKLLFSTVRIKLTLSDGREGVGTGFFFRFSMGDDKFVPAIVTNRHVPHGAVTGSFQLHEAVAVGGTPSPSGRFFTVNMDNFAARWIPHPVGADLCAMPIQPLLVEAKERFGKEVFYITLDESILPSNQVLGDLGAIEEVVMAGYPTGLWDQANNMPIVRRGITASHPALDFNGKAEGLIDAACFPGCSGSPVLILNVGTYATKAGHINIGSRILLLGVLYGGPEYTAEGGIVVKEIPMQATPVAQMKLPMNLGFYVKAREILTLGETLKKRIREAQL